MEPLTWTGSLAGLNIIFLGLTVLLALAVAVQIVVSFFPASEARQINPDGTVARQGGLAGGVNRAVILLFALLILVLLIYIIAGAFMGPQAGICLLYTSPSPRD